MQKTNFLVIVKVEFISNFSFRSKKVRRFQFVYLNESSCTIRFLGLTSSNPLVIATAHLSGPELLINQESGKYEFDYRNKTMILQMVKEEEIPPTQRRTTTQRNYPQLRVVRPRVTEPSYRYNDCIGIDGRLMCGSSAISASMLLLCCLISINFVH